MITNEVLANKLYDMFDALFDYVGDNLGFIKVLKEKSAELIRSIISEIEDGFIEGINDVLPWIKSQLEGLIMASAPPAQATMAKAMAVPQVMNFVKKSHAEGEGSGAASATQP